MTNVALSVDNNAAIAAAHGNRATSRLSGSGGALSADAPGDLYGVLAMLDEVWVTDTALANAVVQVNAGTVAANLGTGGQYQITGILNVGSDTDITNSTLSVDDNRVLALATGSNAVADTTLAFTTLESSAATAVQQIQTGATIASVGGSGGGVEINALTHTQVEANLINSTISASGNSAGAQATGATSAAGLTAGGEDTVTLASGYSNTAAAPSATFNLDTGATTLSADYMVGMQQVIVGGTSASAHDLSVYVQGGNLAGGSLTADGNFLTAQATGGSSTGNLTLPQRHDRRRRERQYGQRCPRQRAVPGRPGLGHPERCRCQRHRRRPDHRRHRHQQRRSRLRGRQHPAGSRHRSELGQQPDHRRRHQRGRGRRRTGSCN